MPDHASQSPSNLTELQLDALREMGNLGCGHAANALSQLLGGRTVSIDVPRALVAAYREGASLIGGSELPTVGVATDLCGGLQGRMLILLPVQAARTLAEALLATPAPAGELTDEARSAICEAGNILVSACLNAIATTLHMTLLPSPPSYSLATAGTVLLEGVPELANDQAQAVMIALRFEAKGEPAVAGHFLIVVDQLSLPALFGSMGV